MHEDDIELVKSIREVVDLFRNMLCEAVIFCNRISVFIPVEHFLIKYSIPEIFSTIIMRVASFGRATRGKAACH